MKLSTPTLSSAFSHWNASANSARLALLRAFCAVAEDAQLCSVEPGSAAACVSAWLGDAQRRLCVLGGRESMTRSLGSVYGGSVVRFLGGFRGVTSHVIPSPDAYWKLVSVTRDGTTLLVLCANVSECAIHAFRASDGTHLRSVGSFGTGPLQFSHPSQICALADDFVLVAERGTSRVQVLTPALEFHDFVGVGVLETPTGVCGDSSVIAVCQRVEYFIQIFSRSDGGLLRCFGTTNYYRSDGRMLFPYAVCFLLEQRLIAVLDIFSEDICVFSLEGSLVRRIRLPMCSEPRSIACSDTGSDELIVAGYRNCVVLSAHGELLKAFAADHVSSVASHGGTIFVQECIGHCVAFT